MSLFAMLADKVVQKVEEQVLKAQRVQSFRFDKKKFSTAQAKKWLADHGAKAGKVDETPNQLRFRQFPPGKCKKGTHQVLSRNFPAGITAVSCDVKD